MHPNSPHPTQRRTPGITGKKEKLVVAGCLSSNKRFPFLKRTLQYFLESKDKENVMRKHIREKCIRKTGFFYILSSWTHGRGNSSNSLCRFVLFLHLVVKPLGMNVTVSPLIFIEKSRPCAFIQIKNDNNRTPVITIIGVPFTVLTFEVNREFISSDLFEPHSSTKRKSFSL